MKDNKQTLKKYAVFALMGIAFAGCLWMIFAPSADDKQKQAMTQGYNDRIPDPAAGDIIGDKRDAYQMENMKQRQQETMVSLQDYSSMLNPGSDDNPGLQQGEQQTPRQEQAQSAINSSAASYRDINRTLGTFYQPPQNDEREQEILALEWRLQELEKKLQEKDSRQAAMDEQVALMEKSYELAARYIPQYQGEGNVRYPDEAAMPQQQSDGLSAQEMKNRIGRAANTGDTGDKVKISPVGRTTDRTVSALGQDYADGELVRMYGQPRNFGFNTPGNNNNETGRNTIKACVHGDQTVISGQSVFIRLLEPVIVDNVTVPVNAIITAGANLQGERLALSVSSIEYQGVIYPVKMSVYDTDGTKGVYVPASMELDALKEVAANMGNAMGTSFTMTQSASAQIASDLTKGVIQGASQYFAKKIRLVKINLKAGHKLLLYPEKQ